MTPQEIEFVVGKLDESIVSQWDFGTFIDFLLGMQTKLSIIRQAVTNANQEKINASKGSWKSQRRNVMFISDEAVAASAPPTEALKAIVLNCKTNDQLYNDTGFEEIPALMFNEEARNNEITCWKRPQEFSDDPCIFVDDGDEGNMVIGHLSDEWLINALACKLLHKSPTHPSALGGRL